MRQTRRYIYTREATLMLLVVAAWVCMVMVFLLAWLWLQGLSPKLSEVTPGDSTAHGLVVATALWYTVLSVVLLIVHFAVPAEERRVDAMWDTLRNLSLAENSFNASGSYTHI